MAKQCEEKFTTIDGESFYKIENYDLMEDFFMTITSSSDIWNFCWSKGGITAGRIDCDHALFPYYTADKVSDARSFTGAYTLVEVSKNGRTQYWEPFSTLSNSIIVKFTSEEKFQYNIYKNIEGSCVWFEEINKELELSFRYCWTSSAKFGLVRKSFVENLSNDKVSLKILDGCRNILPPCCTADFQNSSSVLLDAYKKTDLIQNVKLSLFSLSAVVSDKAEPSEALYANTCWFSTDDKVYTDPSTPELFVNSKDKDGLQQTITLKGKRASCFIIKNVELDGTNKNESWYQVFDTSLDIARIEDLVNIISNKKEATKLLEDDIKANKEKLSDFVSQADGIQNTADKMTCTHHYANVMFNIMRGGVFTDNGKINLNDFVNFVSLRNKAQGEGVKTFITKSFPKTESVDYKTLYTKILSSNDNQLIRQFLEYMPLTFSRRHGDPSRPWNRFNIKLQDDNGNPILNYEGNWRDIFQNWEALSWSYPQYIKNMCSKFVNAMTADGFNPYRISRQGIDWEIPEENNPWAHIGYWGDHQVIYLEKLLEVYSGINRKELTSLLNKELFTSANVPFKIKNFDEILQNPRDTIFFDRNMSDSLIEKAKAYGSDAKLILDENGNPFLVTLTTKLLQIVISKVANLVPGGGIWLNTQRPEWNDANNALAGYGLSMVTVCYLRRYISFLIELYKDSTEQGFILPKETAECFTSLSALFVQNGNETVCSDDKKRFEFVKEEGQIFEKERNSLYKNGYSSEKVEITKEQIVQNLQAINSLLEITIKMNKRTDKEAESLYHSYNTLKIGKEEMKVETLQEMLEGQVAVLSSGLLSPSEALAVFKALKTSRMFEERQYSYTLYPNKELPFFTSKNCVSQEDAAPLADLLKKTGGKILKEDCNKKYHFNPEFRNARLMKEYISTLPDCQKPTESEKTELADLYEKTFNHQSFTGRSGTFYAYEGLGSIYWHMVSKLLLAAQENVFKAENLYKQEKCDLKTVKELAEVYYDVRKGIGFNKKASVYGAFPSDPYSHTPSNQGAKQPGMTGQVKEEILTRWGELGIRIENGSTYFDPILLKKEEFFENGTLSFTWCGTKITYHLGEKAKIVITTPKYQTSRNENALTKEETEALFNRDNEITSIDIWTTLEGNLLCK